LKSAAFSQLAHRNPKERQNLSPLLRSTDTERFKNTSSASKTKIVRNDYSAFIKNIFLRSFIHPN